MSFLILGKPYAGDSPHYRGTYRHHPAYSENPLCMHYLEEVDSFFLLDDLAFAREFAHTLCEDFEIVRITRGESVEAEHVLGYDVSSGVNLSYLAGGLKFCTGEGERLGLMMCLLERHFQPLLNHHGLFADSSTAHFFLQCVREINQVSPNYFDPPETYEVLAVSQVQ